MLGDTHDCSFEADPRSRPAAALPKDAIRSPPCVRKAPHASRLSTPSSSAARSSLLLLSVRAKRRTPRASARAKQLSRMPWCARSAARLAPRREPSSTADCAGAREAPHASRLGASQATQPHALVRAKRRTLAPQRAPSSTADCPEPKRAKSLGRQDHDLRSRLGRLGLRELTAQAHAISKRSAGGQAHLVTARQENAQAQHDQRSAASQQHQQPKPHPTIGIGARGIASGPLPHTRHAGPHRAVRRVEVTTPAGGCPVGGSSGWEKRRG
jgi:hypothetical protein